MDLAFYTLASTPTPTQMESITMPVDPASIGVAIAGAGVTVLLIWFGYRTGFGLVKKLLGRMMKAM